MPSSDIRKNLRVGLSGEQGTEYIKLQKDIVLIATTLLKISKKTLGLDDDLSRLALDSLTVTNLAQAINGVFKLSLTPANFYGHKTIGSLIDYMYNSNRDKLFEYYQQAPKAITNELILSEISDQSSDSVLLKKNQHIRSPDKKSVHQIDDNTIAGITRMSLMCLSADNTEMLVLYAKRLLQLCNENKRDQTLLKAFECFLLHDQAFMNIRLGIIVESMDALCEKLSTFINTGNIPAGCYMGTAKQGCCQISVFQETGVVEKMSTQFQRNENLEKVVVLWVHGIKLNWDKLHGPNRCELIHAKQAKFHDIFSTNV